MPNAVCSKNISWNYANDLPLFSISSPDPPGTLAAMYNVYFTCTASLQGGSPCNMFNTSKVFKTVFNTLLLAIRTMCNLITNVLCIARNIITHMIDSIDMLNYILTGIELECNLNLDLERLYSYTFDTYLMFTDSVRDRTYIISNNILQGATMLFDDFCEKSYAFCLGGLKYLSILKKQFVFSTDEDMIIKIFEVLKFCKIILGVGRARSWGFVGGVHLVGHCATEYLKTGLFRANYSNNNNTYIFFEFYSRDIRLEPCFRYYYLKFLTVSNDRYQTSGLTYSYRFNNSLKRKDILYFTVSRMFRWFKGIGNLQWDSCALISVLHVALDHIYNNQICLKYDDKLLFVFRSYIARSRTIKRIAHADLPVSSRTQKRIPSVRSVRSGSFNRNKSCSNYDVGTYVTPQTPLYTHSFISPNHSHSQYTDWITVSKFDSIVTLLLFVLISFVFEWYCDLLKPCKPGKSSLSFSFTFSASRISARSKSKGSKSTSTSSFLESGVLWPVFGNNLDIQATVIMLHSCDTDSVTVSSDSEFETSTSLGATTSGPCNTSDSEANASTNLKRNQTPTSTPKKKKFLSRRGKAVKYHPYLQDEEEEEDDINLKPCSLSKMLTISPLLKPGEKLEKRFRTYSQTSNQSMCSQPDSVSQDKKKNVHKVINENGSYHLDKAKECNFHYMEDFIITSDESDTLFSDLKSLTFSENNPKNLSLEFRIPLEQNSFSSDHTESNELYKLLSHYAVNVEKAAMSIFNMQAKFDKITLKKLANEKEHIPYQSHLVDDNSENVDPLVAILSVGTPRTLSLKTVKGKKITHQVPLHAGSLCIMSGNTLDKYQYSIPKCVGGLTDQFCLLFTGTLLSSSSIPHITSTTMIDSTSYTSDTSEAENRGVVANESPNMNKVTPTINAETLPDIIITQTEDQDKIKPLPHDKSPEELKQSPSDANEILNEDEDPEQTVIRVQHKDSSFLLGESLVACINHMPVKNIDEELRRHQCSITGSVDVRRNRLITFMCTELGKISSVSDTNEQTSVNQHLSGIERTLIDKVHSINNLTDEIATLKLEILSLTKPKSKLNTDESTEIKQLKDLWKENLLTTKLLQGRIDAISNDVVRAEEQALDVEAIVLKTRNDLESWHNSAFFHEDSRLLKDIHDYVTSGNLEATINCKCSAQDRDASKNNIPLSDEFIAASSSCSKDDERNPRTTSSPAPSTSFTRLSSSSPPANPVVGYHDTSQSKTPDSQSSSRRPPVFNMTNSTHRVVPSAPPTEYLQQHSKAPYSQVLKLNPNPQQGISVSSSRQQTRSYQDDGSPSRAINRKFTTILITDSIMRHISDDSLGVNHDLRIINKSYALQLSEGRLRESLKRMKPDFVYVHLGINDVFQGLPAKQIISYICEFTLFTDEELPNTKVILSLPLPTNNTAECRVIKELRSLMFHWISNCDTNIELEKRQVIFNSNSNFERLSDERSRDPPILQVDGLFSRDGIHLSYKGKTTILANFRHAIHDLTRRITGKRPQTRGSVR